MPLMRWVCTYLVLTMKHVPDNIQQLSVVKEYGDVREIESPQWQTHYLIDCQGLQGGLALTAGTRE